MLITTHQEFTEQLNDGPYAWPGGYPKYFLMADGETLSFGAAQENKELIIDAINNGGDEQWEVKAVEINWEDNSLFCAHSNEKIPSAYGED